MDNKSYTLGECLSATGLRALPKPIAEGENKIWLSGIALVSKGGFEEYCLVTSDIEGRPSVSKDFGECRAINRFIAIYPVECYSGFDIIPPLKTDKSIVTYLCKSRHDPAEIEALLSTEGKSEEQIRKDRAVIDKYIKELAFRNAKAKQAERERVNKMKYYNGATED